MRIITLILIAAFSVLPNSTPASAQIVIRGRAGNQGGEGTTIGPKIGERKFADKPFGRVWHSKISMQNAMKYAGEISEELEIKRSMFMMMPSGAGNVAGQGMASLSTPVQELKGMLVYLTKGLIPTPVTINFKRVADEAEFRKLVLKSKNNWGEMATLVGKGNRYEVKVDFQQMRMGGPLPAPGEGAEGDGQPRVAISFSARIGGEPAADDDKGEPANAPQFEMSSMSTFYRYHDGIMFDAQAPELHDMKLPSIKDLTLRKSQEALDLYADVDLSQIPQAFKEVFWNAIKVKANAFMQQYDDEPQEEYAVRKTSGQFTMELTRAAILDVDRIRLSLSFAKGEKPLDLDVLVDARKNSNLAKQLGQVSGGVSRFDVLRQQESPMTIASAWQMPKDFRTYLKALFDQGKLRLQEQLASDADGLLAVEDMFEVLAKTVDAGAADAIVKLGGDAATGYSLYGGLRITGAEELAKNLTMTLNRLPASPENQIHVTREDGREFLSFRLDELHLPGIEGNQQLPAQLHFTVAESCLWFSVGGTTSFDVLKTCLTDFRSEKTKATAQAAPFVLDMHLGDWLKSAETEAQNQFSEMPMRTLQRFEQGLHRAISKPFKVSFQMPGQDMKAPDMAFRQSYLAKAIASGQDELHVEIDTSPKSLRVKARIGEGLIKFVVAQILDVQNRAFENMDIQFQPGEDGAQSITIKGGSGTFSAPGDGK